METKLRRLNRLILVFFTSITEPMATAARAVRSPCRRSRVAHRLKTTKYIPKYTARSSNSISHYNPCAQPSKTKSTRRLFIARPDRETIRSPVPAELCVDRVDGWVWQLNSRRVRRPAGLAGYRYGNGALFLVACGDPRHRAQTGSGRLGAKGLLHIG